MMVIEEGKNVWRVVGSRRVAFLLDGEAYFQAVAETIEKARKSVYIIGWDFNSDILLLRDGGSESSGLCLEDLLWDVLEGQPELNVYVLIWDFAMLYAFERDLVPLFHMAWSGEPRLHFHLDDRHAVGGCHHQKIVVVDDSVAFVGGMDLTKSRWDTPRHDPNDVRRVDPGGDTYPPFHDVQMQVDGAAAQALGELARDRWRRATSESPRDAGADGEEHDVWPSSVEPHMKNVDVAIARTWPAVDGDREIREIERIYLDTIASAERFVYIENQYFTSSTIVTALVERLRQRKDLEIVAVFPRRCSGWLEENTMGLLRVRALKRLQGADGSRRVRVYYPVVQNAGQVFVHSKLLIADDRVLVMGSANLSNRSMGLDSECDLVIEGSKDSDTGKGIASLREKLLAEHLDAAIPDVAAKLDETASLVQTVEALRGRERSLEPLEVEESEWNEQLAHSISAVDPERPVHPEELVERLVPARQPRESRRIAWRLGLTVVVLVVLAVLWRWTSLGETIDQETLMEWVALVARSPVTPLVVVVGFVAASLLMIPMTLLIVVTALAFEPLTALVYALSGGVLSSAAGFGLGRVLGKDAIRRLAGARLNRVSKRLARSGIVAMTAARLLPLGPFTVVNLVAGASHLRFRDFIAGSFLGLLPGVCAVTILKDRLEGVIREPSLANVMTLVGAGLLVLLGVLGTRRLFGGPEAADE